MYTKTCLGVVLFFVFTFLNGRAQKTIGWQMQSVPVKTRWAKQVSPLNVWKEYPRPQMVRKDNWQNLNGLWNYTITDSPTDIPHDFDGQILVPYPLESALSGVKKTLKPTQFLWYNRTFIYKGKKHRKALLHFGAVDYRAWVFLNGKLVGEHEGGYTSFEIDISEALKVGENELSIKIYDPSDKGIGPHGKQVLDPANIYYTPSSGIWQTVWLESLPFLFVKDLHITPDVDSGCLKVNVKTTGTNDVELIISTGSSTVGRIKGKSNTVIKIPIKNAHLWSPEDPFLYDLTVKLSSAGNVVDEVRSYFGMRKIAIQKDEKGVDRIFLNNNPYYNLGVLDQGFWPDGLYTAPNDNALKFDIESIKAMGFNTIRKHIKVEPARWYYYADKIGMLVWQDFVNPNQALPLGAKAEYEKECSETIAQLHNFPSVVMWVIFNEKWGAYEQQRITEWVKSIDPSRIVNGHSGEMLYVNGKLRSPSPNAWIGADLTDVHSYPNPMDAPVESGKARVLGEFGGIGVFIPDHQWNTASAWGYISEYPSSFISRYREINNTLIRLKADGLSGSIYTQPFDVEGEQNGLMTYDRKVLKIPFDSIRDIHQLLNPGLKHQKMPNINITDADLTPPDVVYDRMLNQFADGKRDRRFLYNLSVMAVQFNDSVNRVEISKSYIDQLGNNLSYEDLNFLQQTTKNLDDPSFKFTIKNQKLIGNIVGAGESTILSAKKIIQSYIHDKLMVEKEKIEFNSFELEIVAKYGGIGQLAVWESLAMYSFRKKDVIPFVKYKNQILKNYPTAINNWTLANDSWFVFENAAIDDVKSLKTGLDWSEKIIKEEPNNAPNIDTYANILYKMGRREEALTWQSKALKLEPGRKELIDNYERMKRGEPTWK